MEFLVDDAEIEAAEMTDATVEEALRIVQIDIAPPGSLVVALRCDGQDVQGEDMARTLGRPVSDFERLEVFTAAKRTLVTDAMDQAMQTLGASSEECQRIAGLLAEGRTSDGIQALGGCLGMWQQIHDAIGKTINLLGLRDDEVMVAERTLMEVLERPRDMLLDIKKALTAHDHVLLADILQYEFGEVLNSWRSILETLRAQAVDLDD